MPQDGSSNYQYPPGTPGIPDTTIESEAYNTFLDDLVTNDLNIPRPIHRGGTGASTATQALINLGGEKSSQVVTNYDTQVFLSGSFYSAVGATNAPVAGHAFAGIAYTSDPPATPPADLNVVIEARDQSDTQVPGMVYVREKKAGVWGIWRSASALVTGQTPPASAPDSALFWDTDTGVLYINYNDGNTTQWVQAVALPAVDTSFFVQKSGDTMSGDLTISSGGPSLLLNGTDNAALPEVTFQQANINRWSSYVSSGPTANYNIARHDDVGTLIESVLTASRSTGLLTVAGNPTAALGIATKSYVDAVTFNARGYISGVNLVWTTLSSFTVNPGVAAASNASTMILLSAALTKTTAVWAVGSNTGCLDTGAFTTNTWYHVYLIKRLDLGIVDVLISLSPTAPTLPANYTVFRRIGSLRTGVAIQWAKFSQLGDEFLWDVSALDASGLTGSTAAQTLTLTVPTGIQVNATVDTLGIATGGAPYDGRFLISPLDVADEAPTVHFNLGIYNASAGSQACDQMHIRTNTSGQIRVRAMTATASLYLSTAGWIDRRGRDD